VIDDQRRESLRIVSDAMYDVQPEQYPTVIREMSQHEDDVTNHRIMWLLVGQGFLANAYVSVKTEDLSAHFKLSLAGLLVSLSAFVMLYQSYQARGYLLFLGQQAKQGILREEHLPLIGLPRNKIKGWWRNSWTCPWFGQTRDLLEPWLLLPFLFTSVWMIVLFHTSSSLNAAVAWALGVLLSAVILCVFCVVLVWSQSKDEEELKIGPPRF
jgi:hypothetical protein